MAQEELDAIETEAYADLAIEDWERPQGESVQDLAESHLQAEANRFMREERYAKHLFDARFGV